MDEQQLSQRKDWAKGADPFELVGVVREGVHETLGGGLSQLPEDKQAQIVAATEEMATRFEQQSRAVLGSQPPPTGV